MFLLLLLFVDYFDWRVLSRNLLGNNYIYWLLRNVFSNLLWLDNFICCDPTSLLEPQLFSLLSVRLLRLSLLLRGSLRLLRLLFWLLLRWSSRFSGVLFTLLFNSSSLISRFASLLLLSSRPIGLVVLQLLHTQPHDVLHFI